MSLRYLIHLPLALSLLLSSRLAFAVDLQRALDPQHTSLSNQTRAGQSNSRADRVSKLLVNPKVFEGLAPKEKQELKQRLMNLKSRGGNSGGGGDDLALEFRQVFSSALKEINEKMPEVSAQLTALKLTDVLNKSLIIVVDDALEVEVKGLIQNSTAYNSPALGIILLNRDRWNGIKKSCLKGGVAIHEVASLKGIEQTGYYPVSGAYVTLDSCGEQQDELAKQLASDRAKTMQAEAPIQNQHTILQRFFEEAREDLTLDDVFETARTSICAMSPAKAPYQGYIADIKFAPAEYVITPEADLIPGHGPLLKDIAGTPAVMGKTFSVNVDDFHKYEYFGFPQTIPSYPYQNKTGQEIDMNGHTDGNVNVIQIRKNNGMITVRMNWFPVDETIGSADYAPQDAYAYCYSKEYHE